MAIVPFRKKLIPYRFFNACYVVAGLMLVGFLLGMVWPDSLFWLALSAPDIDSFRAWQFLTWPLVEPFGGTTILNLVFNILALAIFGSKVEQEMGSIHFLIFGTAVTVLTGILGLGVFHLAGLPGYPVYGSFALVLAIITAYAAFYPDAVVHLLGIFPLRSPVLLAMLAGIELVLVLTSYGPPYLVHLAGLGMAWLFVFVRYRANPFRHLFRG